MNESTGSVRLERRGAAAHVVVHRPGRRNAMTMEMYERLESHLAEVAEAPDLRVLVLRGGGGAFIAGTDIEHFRGFASAGDGLRYEERVEEVVRRLETLPIATVAAIEGACVGGGLILAAACDLRLCTPDARFGVPVARTVGHGLSMANTARLVAEFGAGPTRAMLLLADLLDAEEARRCGFVHAVVPAAGVDARLEEWVERLSGNAPLSLRAAKEAVRRVTRAGGNVDDEDLLREVYGSADFRRGVEAFLERRRPQWEGR